MRITIITVGSTGDVIPFINLGHELEGRGHDITIAAFPAFRDMVLKEGFRFFSLNGDAVKFMNDVFRPGSTSLSYLSRLKKTFGRTVPSLLSSMSDSCADADALVCNFFGTFYYSVAEKYNIPCIQTYFFLMEPSWDIPISSIKRQNLPRLLNRLTYSVAYLLIGIVERRYLYRWRKENGVDTRRPRLKPDRSIRGHYVPSVYAISPSFYRIPSKEDSHVEMSGFWFAPENHDYLPPEGLSEFILNGAPPIYIGFGSMNSGNMEELLDTVIKSVRMAQLRAVIYLGWSGGNPEHASDDIWFAEKYISHDWLFPRVSAVVHHGGAGTTSMGLRYGKPTLTIPFSGDQYFWAERVRYLGCGPEPISRDALTTENLTSALRKLTSVPDYRLCSEKLAQVFSKEKGVAVAADIIEREITAW